MRYFITFYTFMKGGNITTGILLSSKFEERVSNQSIVENLVRKHNVFPSQLDIKITVEIAETEYNRIIS